MGRRVALVEYPDGQAIPADYGNWLQCHKCGHIFPIYEKKNEPVIQDFTETFDNPFDVQKHGHYLIWKQTVKIMIINNRILVEILFVILL